MNFNEKGNILSPNTNNSMNKILIKEGKTPESQQALNNIKHISSQNTRSTIYGGIKFK